MLPFAEKHVCITAEEKTRKSLLFHGNKTWMKKGCGLFDATMGAFDGAEVFELVGIFLLDKLSSVYNKKCVGIYRDDGFGSF